MNVDDIHPLRWKRLTPGSDDYIDIAKRARGDIRDEFSLNLIVDSVQEEYKWALEDLAEDERPSFHRAGGKAGELAVFASRFFALGQNMFEVSPDLAPSLGSSDLGDIRFDEIKLPYRFFWLSLAHMGEEEGLYGEPNVIDGVYVDATVPGLWTLAFTTKRTDVDHDRDLWPKNIEDHFLMGFKTPSQSATFKEVLEDSISRNFTKLAEVPQTWSYADRPGFTPNGFDENGNALYLQRDHRGVLREIVDVRERNERQQIERNVASMPAVERALTKVANFLAYMSLAPSERSQKDGYSDDAPRELVEQVKNGFSSGARQRAALALSHAGFSKINIIGLSAAALERRIQEDHGQELAFSHTRRGHFKHQVYGPNRSLRKLIWIEDTQVRPDLPLRPGHGHQYIAREMDDTDSLGSPIVPQGPRF